jgi:hypothetical protein
MANSGEIVCVATYLSPITSVALKYGIEKALKTVLQATFCVVVCTVSAAWNDAGQAVEADPFQTDCQSKCRDDRSRHFREFDEAAHGRFPVSPGAFLLLVLRRSATGTSAGAQPAADCMEIRGLANLSDQERVAPRTRCGKP